MYFASTSEIGLIGQKSALHEPIEVFDMTQDIEILQFLHYNPEASRAEIGETLTNAPSPATLKRPIAEGKSTSPFCLLP